MRGMKPEWPLYGLCILGAALTAAAQDVFGWSDQTAENVLAGCIVVAMGTYLPLVTRRREKRGAS